MNFTETALDPLSAVQKWLWASIDAATNFSDLRQPNRIKLDGATSSPKENVQLADMPELVLTMPGIVKSGLNSNTDKLDLSCRFSISTGTMQFYNKLPFLLWRLIVVIGALEGTAPNLGTGISMESMSIRNGFLGFNMETNNRGLVGHAANLEFDLQLHIARALYVIG